LTLFINRVALVPWAWENLKYIFPSDNNTIEDQKASFGFSYLLSSVGLELFGEIGVDDYVYGKILGYIRDPFWTMVYTAGLKKTIVINPDKNIYGEAILEVNWLERTQATEYPPRSSYTFYFHHLLTHGYTNRGQWLGNAESPGGNSQNLTFVLYYPQGKSQIIFGRNNPDKNYLYNARVDGFNNPWANFIAGIHTTYFFKSFLAVSGGFVYNLIINRHYIRENEVMVNGRINGGDDTYAHNVYINASIKFMF
jgi:hypothetical protein